MHNIAVSLAHQVRCCNYSGHVWP